MRTLAFVAVAALVIVSLAAHGSEILSRLGNGRHIMAGLLHDCHLDSPIEPPRALRRHLSIGKRLWLVTHSELGAVTLAQAKLNAVDDVQIQAIDEFRKSSFLLDSMQFDDVVNPAGGGATWTYGYQRVVTQPTSQTRAINTEYTPQESTKQRFTTDLKIHGGSFAIDRAVADIGGANSEIAFQMQQKIKAARSKFHHLAIKGDSATDANSFDGLDKMLVGTTTEFGAASGPPLIDISTSALLDSNGNAFIDLLDEFLGLLDEKPDAIVTNSKGKARVISIARRLGYKTESEDSFGRKIDTYDGIPIVDIGKQPGSNTEIIEAYTVGATTGMVDYFALRFGLDAFHGISLAGRDLVKTYLPDLSAPGAVKTGEVEMISAVVLKATKAAGVMRRVKVQ